MPQASGVSLHQIHPPPDADAETDVDIIAIHGLDTKSPDTWIWRSKRSDNNVNWLADKDMLPSRVGQARIFTCDWPSDLFERSDLIQKRIEELARLLLDGIQRRPSATNSSSGRDRPIVFIASCLGGIILMKALVMADNEYLSLRRATRAIIFLATPFGGTSFQDVSRWAEPGLKTWASIRGQKVSRLLQSVKGSTFDLDELVRGFTQLCRHDDLDRVMTFYEMGKTNLYHKVFPYLPISSKQLVNKSSATLQIVPDPLPLDRPHKTMNKFPSHEDPEYQKVAGKLEQFLQGIRERTLLQGADTYIRDRHYTKERLIIERLSGECLPMEQCYINLVVVEKPGELANRSEEAPKEADSAAQSSPFSVFARQKVETPDKSVQVELATIFNERKRPNGSTIKPRRILIRGRAGVGKTTLCKKIVHEFTQGTWVGWSKLFHRVLWVPLRKLKLQERRQVPGYNLEDLFYHEYFSGECQDDGRCLARELWRALKDTGSSRSLFILDGLDEVSQDLENADAMSQFLKELLQQPNVIITSRPSARAPPDIDLELETVGFYPDQVKDYIEKAFTDRETKVTNVKKVNEVQSFVQEHWLIEGLVRIPIQVDALCYTWDGLNPEDIPDTMTGMYRLSELKLWKKDVIRLEKKHDGTLITPSQITTSDAEDFVQDEICFLEGLAFTGLYNNAIEFSLRDREVISKQFKPRGMLLDKALPCLSFVRTSDPSSKVEHQNYHFIHLTFQEYFAARYFIRQWHAGRPLKCLELGSVKINETEPGRFIQKHKYTARYDIFWRFVAGLLDATQQASRFIDLIEKEPLDLLGPTHQRLAMHCLSEISNDLRIRTNLEARLPQWLLFEVNLTGSSLLARESECPEECILAVLKNDSGSGRNRILQALQYRGTNLSEAAIAALTALLQDKDWDIRYAAAQALGRQTNLSNAAIAAIAALTALLQDQEWSVRSAAAEALGNQSNLSDAAIAVIAALTALLQDKDWEVRSAAAEALGGQPNLSSTAIAALIAVLQDKGWEVGSAAAEALGGQSKLSDAAIAALTALLHDKHRDVRYAATQALSYQSNLSDAAIAALTALLQDKDWDVRSAAVKALGKQSNLSDAAIGALTALFHDKDRDVRSAATQAMGYRSDLSNTAIAALTALLHDEEPLVRSAAAEALGNQSILSDAAIAAPLKALLQDKEPFVRSAAAEALGNQSILSNATIAALIAVLQDKDWKVRSAAAEALGRQPNLSSTAIAALTARRYDTDRYVRSAAAEALGKQSNLSYVDISALTALLHDEERNVRYAAAKALGGQPDLSGSAITVLMELLQDENRDVQFAAAQVLGGQSNLSDAAFSALTALLQNKNWDVRSSAAQVLRGLNLSDAAIAALTALLQDKDWDIRSSAAEALGTQSILSNATIEVLTALLQDEEEGVQHIAAQVLCGQSNLSDAAIEALTPLLQHKDPHVRSYATQALGDQSNLSGAAIEALTALLQDKDWDVRSSAAYTLGGQSNFLDKILEAMGLLLESERATNSMRSTFRNSQFLKSLYGSLLCRSFREQLSLCIDGDRGIRSCIINQPKGVRMASFDDDGVDDQFCAALGECRQLWNIHGCKLWVNLGYDAVQ